MTEAAEASVACDRIPTLDGDLSVYPLQHATLALTLKEHTLYVDPVGGAARFAGLPRPTLVLLTDIHGDHLNVDTLKALVTDKTRIIASPAAMAQLPEDLRVRTTALGNGQTTNASGVSVEAVPAYNTTQGRLDYHAKGRGNGYILVMGGKRVYISGDTEDIPEMRGLKDIDVAFLCMNLPYTMTVQQAADAVRAFKPKVIYPYHSRGSDLGEFTRLVGTNSGVEVLLREWYMPK